MIRNPQHRKQFVSRLSEVAMNPGIRGWNLLTSPHHIRTLAITVVWIAYFMVLLSHMEIRVRPGHPSHISVSDWLVVYYFANLCHSQLYPAGCAVIQPGSKTSGNLKNLQWCALVPFHCILIALSLQDAILM